METEYLTPKKAGKLLGYSSEKVRNMCEEGAFPNAHRYGHSGWWRIPASDVDELKERTRTKVLRRKAHG